MSETVLHEASVIEQRIREELRHFRPEHQACWTFENEATSAHACLRDSLAAITRLTQALTEAQRWDQTYRDAMRSAAMSLNECSLDRDTARAELATIRQQLAALRVVYDANAEDALYVPGEQTIWRWARELLDSFAPEPAEDAKVAPQGAAPTDRT